VSKNEPQSLAELDQLAASVDAMNEADPAGKRASAATLKAGQAAVDALNARKGWFS
jgi:hypothetical protein